MITSKLFSLTSYLKHATTILFVVGFFIDMVLLPDINDRLTQYIGLVYLFGIALLIIFREWVVERNTATTLERKVYTCITFSIAYLSGSALSFVFVYSLRGAALSVSWPLLFLLVLCSVANELVSSHKYRFTLDIGVFFIATLFYTIFNVPIILKSQSDFTFVVSLLFSTLFGFLYISFLKRTGEVARYEAPRGYALALGIPMFVGMLYILNVIPAVPLSLASGGVYHAITKYDDGSYLAKREVPDGQLSYFKTQTYHLSPYDNGVYVFASVKAPAQLTAPISHVWEYYDDTKSTWVESSVIKYTTEGGREKGYRAYSFKENIEDGLWRVTIQVGNNRVVGRIIFRVVHTPIVPTLESITF